MATSDTEPPDRPDEAAASSNAPEPEAAAEADGATAAEPVPDPRFTVTNYVPPEPVVHFADRVHRTPEEKGEANRRHRAKRRRRLILGWLMLGAGVLILASVVWVGWRSYQAYSHLQTASNQVSTLQKELEDFASVDPAAAAKTVDSLQQETASARSAVDDPIFRAATVTPLLGANLDALREVTLTVDSLATDVMPSLVDIASTLQPSQLAPTNGTIDLSPIERISPLLQNADNAVNDARLRMAAIDRSAVVQPVGDAVANLWKKLDSAADVTGPAARIARLLPPMLGADGPRTYLVVFQNPAELRATGGIFGSFAVVTADKGKISIQEQGASSRILGYFDPPVAKLTKNEINLYSQLMAQYPQDVNFTPDYPTAAPLFAEMYRLRSGKTVDGVLALDPVALSYTLKGTPPIAVGDGVEVTSANLVSVLLSTAYKKFDNDPDQSRRDQFLSSATATVFSEIMSGKADATSIVNGLRKAVNERRVLLYSADADEEADIATTGVSGAITTELGPPTVGVFFNDGTAAKLGYYLANEVKVTEGKCRTDSRRELQVTVTMKYDAPASGLPPYVTGSRPLGTQYILRTNVLVFAPVGGGIVDITERDGKPIRIARGEDHSREVGTVTVELKPGSSTELTFTVLGPANSNGLPDDIEPGLVLTPGVRPWTQSVEEYRNCRVTTG